MSKVKACEVSDLQNYSGLQVLLPDHKSVVLDYVDGAYYAADDLCIHGQAFLSEGDIEDGNIVCPFHGRMFDIKTGEPTAAPFVIPSRTYAVSVDGDSICINIDADA